MTRTAGEMRQLIRDYVRAFNARDFDALISIYAEDATLEDPVGTPIQRGRDAIRAFYEGYGAHPSFLQLTGDFRYAGDAAAFSFFCYLGETGDPMIVHITDSFRFDSEGKVKEMRAFWGEANIHRLPKQADAGDQLPLAGQVILVAGCGDMAERCAGALAEKGALVVSAGDPDGTAAVAREVDARGGRALELSADLADRPALERLAADAIAMAGRLDGCVNMLPGDDAELSARDAACVAAQARALEGQEIAGTIVSIMATADGSSAAIGAPRTRARINRLVRNAASPDDLESTLVWLMSPASSGVAGQTIGLSPAN